MSAFRIQIDLPPPDEGKSAWLTMISPGTHDLETAREITEGYFLPHRVRDVRWMMQEGKRMGRNMDGLTPGTRSEAFTALTPCLPLGSGCGGFRA